MERIVRELESKGTLRVLRSPLVVQDEWNEQWDKRVQALFGSQRPSQMKYGNCIWRAGKLYHASSGEEAMYTHFQRWKLQDPRKFFIAKRRHYADSWIISKKGIRMHFSSPWLALPSWIEISVNFMIRAVHHLRFRIQQFRQVRLT
jgi:hypothetical protein